MAPALRIAPPWKNPGAYRLWAQAFDAAGTTIITSVNPVQLLLAVELLPMSATSNALRFDHGNLVDIQATIPLEPATAVRVAEALAIHDSGGTDPG